LAELCRPCRDPRGHVSISQPRSIFSPALNCAALYISRLPRTLYKNSITSQDESHIYKSIFCRHLDIMLSVLPLSLAALLFASCNALVASRQELSARQSIQLSRKSPPQERSIEDFGKWAKLHKEILESKYGGGSQQQKRSSGTNLYVYLLLFQGALSHMGLGLALALLTRTLMRGTGLLFLPRRKPLIVSVVILVQSR
jgi:hypothetical protein